MTVCTRADKLRMTCSVVGKNKIQICLCFSSLDSCSRLVFCRFVPVHIGCWLIQVPYTNFTTDACQKACLVQQLFFPVHSYTSTALIPSRYSLVHCRHYINDCIPTTKSVPAPSPLAKITRKKGQQAVYLKGQARLSKCSLTNISVAGILTAPELTILRNRSNIFFHP